MVGMLDAKYEKRSIKRSFFLKIVRRISMRKFFLIGAILLSLMFTGCDSEDKKGEKRESVMVAIEAKEVENAPLEDDMDITTEIKKEETAKEKISLDEEELKYLELICSMFQGQKNVKEMDQEELAIYTYKYISGYSYLESLIGLETVFCGNDGGYAKVKGDCILDFYEFLGIPDRIEELNSTFLFYDNGYIYYLPADGDGVDVANIYKVVEEGQEVKLYYHLIHRNFWEEYVGKGVITIESADNEKGYKLADVNFSDENKYVDNFLISASSVLDMQASHSYEVENISDGDISTAWVEGVEGDGIGETIVFDFEGKETISGVEIYSGYHSEVENYENNGKVTDFLLHFSDGTTVKCNLEDTLHQYIEFGTPIIFTFDQEIEADSVTLEIVGVESGLKYQDTCISEIKFMN